MWRLMTPVPGVQGYVQPAWCAFVSHKKCSMSAYWHLPHLHLDAVRQWFPEGCAQLLWHITEFSNYNLTFGSLNWRLNLMLNEWHYSCYSYTLKTCCERKILILKLIIAYAVSHIRVLIGWCFATVSSITSLVLASCQLGLLLELSQIFIVWYHPQKKVDSLLSESLLDDTFLSLHVNLIAGFKVCF